MAMSSYNITVTSLKDSVDITATSLKDYIHPAGLTSLGYVFILILAFSWWATPKPKSYIPLVLHIRGKDEKNQQIPPLLDLLQDGYKHVRPDVYLHSNKQI